MRAGGAGPERRGRNQPKGVESSGSIGGRKGGSRSPRTLTWWPNGTLKADGVWRYFYDERGALTAVYPAANSASSRRYVHDALGGRRRETHATTTEADTDTEIWTSTDGLRPEITIERLRSRPGAATNPWVDTSWMISVLGPNPDERLLYVDATPAVDLVSYPHTDRRGSAVALTRAGAATQRFSYGPYGESTDSTAGYPWRYTGQRLDPVTGLYHYKARDYSAGWGRFLQPDPAGFVDGPNLYAYVSNDPLNRSDPTGREGRNLFPLSEPGLWAQGQRLQEAPSRYYYVAGHASDVAIRDYSAGGGRAASRVYTALELAAVLRADGSTWSGQDIFLMACELGSGNFGSALARELGVYVWAPVGFVEYERHLTDRSATRSSENYLTVGSELNGLRDADSYWQLYAPDGSLVEGARVHSVTIREGRAPIFDRARPGSRPSGPPRTPVEQPPKREK